MTDSPAGGSTSNQSLNPAAYSLAEQKKAIAAGLIAFVGALGQALQAQGADIGLQGMLVALGAGLVAYAATFGISNN